MNYNKPMSNSFTMQNLSGEEIQVGDSVILGRSPGKVVFVISSSQYSPKYPKQAWNYLKEGFGVETEKYGLIQQLEPDEDLKLIR